MGKENVTHYNIHTVPQSAVWPADHVLASRESYCELEADTVASGMVLNRSSREEIKKIMIIVFIHSHIEPLKSTDRRQASPRASHRRD